MAHAEIGDHENAAAVFVAGDCVSDDPRLLSAYSSMTRSDRALLHDRRADAVQATGEPSWSLGALPFHREHGSDPVAAADALRVAVDYCIDMGFYDATVDLGGRGRAVVDWQHQPDHWWAFTTKMTTSLAALGRPVEAEALYDEARHDQQPHPCTCRRRMPPPCSTPGTTSRPTDHERAMGWINEAIAIASLNPDPRERSASRWSSTATVWR